VRRHISSKPDTCTEGADVDAAGISVKVTRITLGGLPSCLVLPIPRGIGKGRQKSAEVIVVGLTDRRRAEHEVRTGALNFDDDRSRRRSG
jgi:hypothetical protein